MKNLFKFIIVSVLLLINSGLGFSQSTGDYQTNGDVTFAAAANWQIYDAGSGWQAASSAPSSSDGVITIRNGHTATVTAVKSIDQTIIASGGFLVINSGITLTIANGAGTDCDVSGRITNSGSISLTGTLVFNNGGIYRHSFTTTGGTIPTSTWNTGSTCEIISYTSNSNMPAGLGQSFYNFKWNCPAQTGNISAGGNLTTVNGDLTIEATNSGQFRIAGNTSPTLAIGGNLVINNGTFNMSSGSGNPIINLSGNFSMSGGTLTESGTGSGIIRFNKSGIQTFTKTAGTISFTIYFAVLSGSILDMGGNVLDNSSGFFNLNSGATLKTTHADGIDDNGFSGCIRGIPTYSTGATYVYYMNGAQNTGDGLPQSSFTGLTVGSTDNATNLTINNATSTAIIGGTLTLISNSTNNSTIASGTIQFGLASGTLKYQGASSQTTTNAEFPSSNGPYSLTIDNANGVTLHSSKSIDGVLTLTSGKLTTGSNTLTLGTSTSSLGFLLPATPTSSSYIVGNFERWIAASTVSDVYFPVGTAAHYLPAIISYTVAPSPGGKLKVTGHDDDPLANNIENLSDGGYTIDRYSNKAWWQFTATTLAGGTYSLNLQGDGITGTDLANFTKLRLLKRDNGSQTWALSGTHVDATGSNTNPLIKRTGLTGFSEFGIGGYSADGNTLGDKPLPVILSSLSSSVINRNVRIDWTTSTETNNSGFEVERAEVRSQNIEFRKIGFINGHGTSNTPTNYSYEDKNLQSGKYKYRLKQIDHNGNYEYFELNGEVEIGVPNKFDL